MTPAFLLLPFDFAEPVWLWLILLIPALVFVSVRSLAGLDAIRRILSITARSVLILLVSVCLAGVEQVRSNDALTVMYLMDRSHSVQQLELFQEEFITETTKKIPPEDYVGVINFARYADVQQLPMRGGYFVPIGRLPALQQTDRTDIGSALRLAMAMFPHDTAKRIVLMSDGNDNMGDVLAEAKRAKADGIPIDIVPLRYEHRNEVYFDRMIAPTQAEPGEMAPVRMIVQTQRRVSGTISIYINDRLYEIPAEQAHVDLNPGVNSFYIKIPMEKSGAQIIRGEFRPDDESMDTVALNNSASAFTFISGASRVLVLSQNTADDVAFVEAMHRENVLVDLMDTADLGDFGLMQMMNYATIVLSNVPAATFTQEQQEQLAVFVKDMGSGLVMLGGDESFGAGGWIGSPVEEVMPVTFEIKHKRVIPRGALVLIMHSCEVPRGNYWGKEMAKKSVDTVSSRDYLGVLAYTYTPGGHNWEVPLDVATNKAAVKAVIDKLQIGDMTDFETPMRMAYKELTSGRAADAAQKHVIILSDGDPSPPSAGLLTNYVDAKITVSTIGIGWGQHVMQQTMNDIATKTGGKFYAARNPKELPQIFVKESKTVRRPLIIDEPFRPQVVAGFSDLFAGLGSGEGVPPLGGLVLTSPKENPNVQVPIVRTTQDGEDPVLAHWQYELGKSVAFTSGYWPVWGREWTPWPKFAKFWAQLVRWTMRQETPANFDVYTKIDGNRGHVFIDALDKDAGYLNYLQFRSRLIDPQREAAPLRFTQTGPGHYEAEFEADQAGQYLANVEVFDGGKPRGTVRTGIAVPFSPEYRDLKTNEVVLRQIAELTGGRWLDLGAREANVFDHNLPESRSKRPAWDWVLAWLLLPGFLLDVSVRRLASWLALSIVAEVAILVVLLFGLGIGFGPWWGVLGAFLLAELIGWAIRFRYIGPLFEFLTHGATALTHAGQRSEAALERLKTTRGRVREKIESSTKVDATTSETASRSARTDVSSRKFEPGVFASGGSTIDLEGELGDAGTVGPGKPPKAEPQTGEMDEDATSRLLRAKRRARKEIDDKGQE